MNCNEKFTSTHFGDCIELNSFNCNCNCKTCNCKQLILRVSISTCFCSMMSSRKYLSGSQKRLKRKNSEQATKKMKGVLRNYLVPNSNLIQNNDSENADSENCAVTDNDSQNVDHCNAVIVITHKLDTDRQSNCVQDEDDVNDMFGTFPAFINENISFNDNETSLDCNYSSVPVYSDDPALWPSVITEEMRDYFIEKQPNQHISEIMNSRKLCSDKSRILTEHSFYRYKHNNEKIKRDWLIYSPSTAAVFCYVCKLYSSSHQALCDEGFSDWKNIAGRLKEHENSQTHRDSVCALSLRAVSCNRIDKQMINEYQNERKYWRNVLTRVVATIKFLAERGLPFFGDDETVGSVKNGNLLGCLELIGKFDPFIADHLARKGNPGKGHTNYLSSTIVAELLQLMSEKVLQHILSEVRKAKYFGLIIDSSPDISHTDQLSIVLRYVNEDGEPKECFIKFLPLNNHSSLSLSICVLNLLESLNLDILNCIKSQLSQCLHKSYYIKRQNF